MKLIIRDDDVSYFTQPEDLERWFSDIWDDIPICLAVVPAIYANQEETPIDQRRKGIWFVCDNKKLITYLRRKIKQGKVNIWQHGHTHKDLDGKHECERKPYDVFLPKTLLKDTFGQKVKVFVAPHDRFCKGWIKEIEKNKMNICRGFSPLPREFMFRYEYIDNFITHLCGYLWYRTKYRPPYWMDFGKHKELYSYRINHITYDNIDEILEWHKKGILCITVHHRSMDQISLEKLKYIIKRYKAWKK